MPALHPDDVKTKRCAVCKRQRQEANHWFLVRVDGATPPVRGESFPIEFTEIDRPLIRELFEGWRGELRIVAWHADLAELPEWRSSCGEEHNGVLMSRWIATGSLDATTAPLADSTPRKEQSE